MEKKYTEVSIYQRGQLEKSLVAIDDKPKLSFPAYDFMMNNNNIVSIATNINSDDVSFSYSIDEYAALQFKNLAYSCICFRGENVAKSVPFMYQKVNQSEKIELDKHQFLDYLENPNDFDTYYEMLFETIKDLDLFGNCFWEVIRIGKKIQFQLLPAQKNRWKFNYSTGEYTLLLSNNKSITFQNDEIIHFRYPTAMRNTIFGKGYIEAGRDIFEAEHAISTYQKKYFINDAMHKYVFTTATNWNDGELAKFYEKYKAEFASPKNAGKTPIFPSGIKPEILSANNKEADYVETWKLTQTRLLSLFRISPSLLGIVEDVNRANAVSAYRDFINFLLDNIVRKIDSKLTKFVKREYGSQFIISSKIELPVDKDFELRRFEASCRYGIITIDEARNDDIIGNYDPIEGGDKLVSSKPEEVIPPVKPDPNNPQE